MKMSTRVQDKILKNIKNEKKKNKKTNEMV